MDRVRAGCVVVLVTVASALFACFPFFFVIAVPPAQAAVPASSDSPLLLYHIPLHSLPFHTFSLSLSLREPLLLQAWSSSACSSLQSCAWLHTSIHSRARPVFPSRRIVSVRSRPGDQGQQPQCADNPLSCASRKWRHQYQHSQRSRRCIYWNSHLLSSGLDPWPTFELSRSARKLTHRCRPLAGDSVSIDGQSAQSGKHEHVHKHHGGSHLGHLDRTVWWLQRTYPCDIFLVLCFFSRISVRLGSHFHLIIECAPLDTVHCRFLTGCSCCSVEKRLQPWHCSPLHASSTFSDLGLSLRPEILETGAESASRPTERATQRCATHPAKGRKELLLCIRIDFIAVSWNNSFKVPCRYHFGIFGKSAPLFLCICLFPFIGGQVVACSRSP